MHTNAEIMLVYRVNGFLKQFHYGRELSYIYNQCMNCYKYVYLIFHVLKTAYPETQTIKLFYLKNKTALL